jgi:outer membrane lipoprotein carrier protein
MTKTREQGSGTRVQDARQRDQPWVPGVSILRPGKSRILAGQLFRPLAVLLCLVFRTHCLFAQDPSAHTIAQLVDSHYNKLRSLRADFTESYNGLGMKRTESGTLILLKPGRMRWDYSSPAGKLFLIHGKFAWFYAKGAPQVQRMAAKQLDDLRSPIRFLLGHTQVEKELGNLQLAGNSQSTIVLVGQPKGQENRIKQVTLTITPGTGSIQSIEIEEIDEAVTRFTFANEQTNVAIPESSFHFEPPAGIPVVDTVPPA